MPEPARHAARILADLDGRLLGSRHLAVLTGEPRPSVTVTPLVRAGLAAVEGGRCRLHSDVAACLKATRQGAWPGQSLVEHLARWSAAHPPVRPREIAGEAEALLWAVRSATQAGELETAWRLARAVAPSFELACRWAAWREILELGLRC
jgi:hypothetical protein